MLIRVRVGKIIWVVYIEQSKGSLLDVLGREDREYIKNEVTQCVAALIAKYHIMYSER